MEAPNFFLVCFPSGDLTTCFRFTTLFCNWGFEIKPHVCLWSLLYLYLCFGWVRICSSTPSSVLLQRYSEAPPLPPCSHHESWLCSGAYQLPKGWLYSFLLLLVHPAFWLVLTQKGASHLIIFCFCISWLSWTLSVFCIRISQIGKGFPGRIGNPILLLRLSSGATDPRLAQGFE